MNCSQEAYEDLANAIALTGIEDYKRALIRLKRDPNSRAAKRAVREGELFLYSSTFAMLTNVNPAYLDRKLRAMIDKQYG